MMMVLILFSLSGQGRLSRLAAHGFDVTLAWGQAAHARSALLQPPGGQQGVDRAGHAAQLQPPACLRGVVVAQPAPAPPPGAQPPPLWGDEGHVLSLLGDRVTDVEASREHLPVELFRSGAEFRDFFKTVYGPTIAVYRSIADDPARVAELDAALAELGDGPDAREWEYLLLTATRA